MTRIGDTYAAAAAAAQDAPANRPVPDQVTDGRTVEIHSTRVALLSPRPENGRSSTVFRNDDSAQEALAAHLAEQSWDDVDGAARLMLAHQERALLATLNAHLGHTLTIDNEDGTNWADGERWFRLDLRCETCGSITIAEATEWENDADEYAPEDDDDEEDES